MPGSGQPQFSSFEKFDYNPEAAIKASAEEKALKDEKTIKDIDRKIDGIYSYLEQIEINNLDLDGKSKEDLNFIKDNIEKLHIYFDKSEIKFDYNFDLQLADRLGNFEADLAYINRMISKCSTQKDELIFKKRIEEFKQELESFIKRIIH